MVVNFFEACEVGNLRVLAWSFQSPCLTWRNSTAICNIYVFRSLTNLCWMHYIFSYLLLYDWQNEVLIKVSRLYHFHMSLFGPTLPYVLARDVAVP
jgi:hypothetical protein